MDYSKEYEKKKLLTNGKSNTKTAKNVKETYYLSLQPTDLNSKKVNLCKFATKECRDACLQYAGRQGFSNVVISRTNKTEFFINERNNFLEKLWGELAVLNEKGNCAVRLNLLSDVDWEKEFTSIKKDMNELKDITFYDYTKDVKKLESSKINNYHLTLSYSGGNWKYCDKYLKVDGNVAMVFAKEIPSTYKGYKVINGDESDERYNDKKGVIVGLKYKVARGKGIDVINNKFIVDGTSSER